METLVQDVRYGGRVLAKNPGFTVVAVLTLGLGIGANSAIFSVISGVLLKKPPVQNPNRVMMALSTNRTRGWGYDPEHPASAPDFLDWRAQNHVFGEMAVVDPWNDFSLTGQGEPQRVSGMRASANYFHLLGASASLGRTFAAGEDQPGHDHEAILSYGLWQTRFGSDPNAIGKTLKLNGEPYTVIGIMPATFRFLVFPSQVWTPLVFDSKQLGPAGRQLRSFYVFGRLRAEVTVEQAQAEMAAIARRLEQTNPEADKGWDTTLLSLQEFQIQEFHIRPALVLLMGTVCFVLLIACANVAGLLVARGAARRHEIAVRAAMGAGRWRLVRQLLCENVLIALAGAGLGTLVAWWGVSLLHAAASFNESVKSMEFGIDKPVLLFTLALALLTVLLFGLAPALQASKVDLHAALKQGGRTGTAGGSRLRMRRVLVTAEIALALLLLTGAGLMIKSFLEEISANHGFNPDRLLTAEISLSGSKYQDPSRQITFFKQVTERIRSVPAVASLAATNSLPLAAEAGKLSFSIEGEPALRAEERPQATYYVVGPGYLEALEIPLIKGRAFTDSDNAAAPPVALVNEAFVRRFFSNREPLGQHINVGGPAVLSGEHAYEATDAGRPGRPAWREVIGVVGNVRDYAGQAGYSPQIYETYLQVPSPNMTLVVRTKYDPALVASAVRRAVWSVDKDQPLGDVTTMSEVIDARGQGGDRLMGELLGIFAGLALTLAAVGIYGIISYAVAQRTHEFGIRMALGAKKHDLLNLVLGEGMKLSGIGLLIGFVAAYPLPRLFASAFPGFSAHAAWVFVIVDVLLALVGLLAAYIPARWATKVDPIVALRYE